MHSEADFVDLIAESVPPAQMFSAVTREVGLLSGADLARMERYETDGTVTGVAGWSRHDEQLAVGTRFTLGSEHRRAGVADERSSAGGQFRLGLGANRTRGSRAGNPFDLDVRVDGRLPDRVEVAAYYAVSEVLTNAAKHSQASVVRVDVATRDGTLCLSVGDDGIGGADLAGGSGLVGLRDRVEALGGALSLRSPRGEGTSLDIELPLV